jgi:predicted ABC-class ATPase
MGAVAVSDKPKDVTSVSRRISRYALEQRSRLEDSCPEKGVRRLMWAILKDTLRCYQSYSDARTIHERRRFIEADQWIHSRDTSWVFSFETICSVLGINSDFLRTEVERWRRRRRIQCG